LLPERPRARRHLFQAPVELTDMASETRMVGRTRDLNLFGCRTEATEISLPVGTKVHVKITYKAAVFTAGGRIVSAGRNFGMGVAFTDVTEKDKLILEKWMAELRAQTGQRSRVSEPVPRG
jgi:hypothetical protein